MWVVAGVGGAAVAPEARVAFAVGAGGVGRVGAELGRATAGTDGTVAGQEPTADYTRKGGKENRRVGV